MNEFQWDSYHKKVERVTGVNWCPYPSEQFMEVILSVDDETAKRLIEKRQTFFFPDFLAGEPMQKELEEINGTQS